MKPLLRSSFSCGCALLRCILPHIRSVVCKELLTPFQLELYFGLQCTEARSRTPSLAELPLHFFSGCGSSRCCGASWSCCEAIRRMSFLLLFGALDCGGRERYPPRYAVIQGVICGRAIWLRAYTATGRHSGAIMRSISGPKMDREPKLF